MKYKVKVYERATNKVVYEGETNGKGTRKEQESWLREITLLKLGIDTYSTDKYAISMKATTLY